MPNALSATAKPIDECDGVTPGIFREEILPASEPVVMRGLVRDWPLVAKATADHGALFAALRRYDNGTPVKAFRAPPDVGGRFFYDETFKGFNFERLAMPLPALLEELTEYAAMDAPPSLYAGGVNVPQHVRSLASDHKNPLLTDDIEQLVSIWVGNKGRVPPHWDLPQNIACVVAGTREFTLFPIDEVPNLYIGPLEFTLAGQPCSLVDLHAPDYERFPKFRTAEASAQIATLGPSDAIYIPSMWVHHVESLDPIGMLVNFWWREGPAHLITPTLTIMHALLTLKGMPAAERKAWRVLMDHFIFEENGPPLEHLPEDARGLFGGPSIDEITKIRKMLGEGLLRH